MKKNKPVLKYVSLIIFVGFILFVVVEFLSNKIKNIQDEIYTIKAQENVNRLNNLISDKKNATNAITIMLSENINIKKFLLSKYKQNYEIKNYSNLLKKNSDFKNVWFQIIDNNGISRYRSWSDKSGDNVSLIRKEIKEILTKPQIKNVISVGKFDLTFKSMVPVYFNDNLIGIVETITHFNSIVKILQDDFIETVILTNKKYKDQIKQPFTNIFIDDYYIANLYNPQNILDFIKENDVDSFWNQTNYKIIDDKFISFYNLKESIGNTMATFVMIDDLKKINSLEVKSLEMFTSITIGSFFIIFIMFSTFLINSLKRQEQTYKNEILSKNNEVLENRVLVELKKNRKKDLILLEQTKHIALTEMLENIAHQWRQPLSVISTAMSGLLMKKDLGLLKEEDFKDYTDVVLKNTAYLSSIIDNFKRFISTDNSINSFYLKEVVDDTYEFLRKMFEDNKIEVVIDIDKNIIIEGDKNGLKQVVLNLFKNAKDSLLEKNEQDKIINISCVSNDEMIKLFFCDNGKGIEKKFFDRIFEPYYTTKHQSLGTGLGLYISKEIITRSFNSKITAKNSTFIYKDNKYKGACIEIEFKI